MKEISMKEAMACATAFAISVNLKVSSQKEKYKEYGLMVGRNTINSQVIWRQPWDELILGNTEVFLPVGPNTERPIDLAFYGDKFYKCSIYEIKETVAKAYLNTSYVELRYDCMGMVDGLSFCRLSGLFSSPHTEWVLVKLRDADIWIPYYSESERRDLFAEAPDFRAQFNF